MRWKNQINICTDTVAHAKFKEVLEIEAKKTGHEKSKLLLALRDSVRKRMHKE
jgi:hypothetical protein